MGVRRRGRALQLLRPNAEWVMQNNVITWLDAIQAQPTESDIATKEAEVSDDEDMLLESANVKEMSVSTSAALSLEQSNDFKLTLSGNIAITFKNINKRTGSSGMIVLVQDATGGRTFTLPSVCKTPVGGATITQVTTANSVSMISYYVMDSSNILVNYIGDFS